MFGRNRSAADVNGIGRADLSAQSECWRMSTETADDTRELDARVIDGEPFIDIRAELQAVAEDETLG